MDNVRATARCEHNWVLRTVDEACDFGRVPLLYWAEPVGDAGAVEGGALRAAGPDGPMDVIRAPVVSASYPAARACMCATRG